MQPYMTSTAVSPSSQHAELTPCVWVADDDRGVLDAVTRILRAVGYGVRAFASGKASVVNVLGDPRVGHARLGGNLLGSTKV